MPALGADLTGATVLVVDDMPGNLELIGELLRPHYQVKVAASGERALRAARTPPIPDLILLDIMMPLMDGYQVLAALQSDSATKEIPVIFVTAMEDDDDEQRGLESGAVDYVTKPIRPTILQARVRTHVELKRHRDQLRRQKELFRRANEIAKDVSLHALATLAEARCEETGAHIVRTREYVEALGRQLLREGRHVEALADGRLALIGRAAPLHDIGKVGIPDHILKKPGKLTREEFAAMKEHSRIGAASIEEAIRRVAQLPDADEAAAREALDLLRIAQQIAGAHHEKWDGSGYPLGLAGDAIPLAARLMALADVYDALTCRRVYKDAMAEDEVRRILYEGRGRHFDPEVVDAFLAVEDEFRTIRQRYADAD
jgi:putative two-component system response regulator